LYCIVLYVAGQDRKIEMFLRGDYKFLLMAMGMKRATSDYACLRCKIHKLQRRDTVKGIHFYSDQILKISNLLKLSNPVKLKKHFPAVTTLFSILSWITLSLMNFALCIFTVIVRFKNSCDFIGRKP
jgi:hypothetical protein